MAIAMNSSTERAFLRAKELLRKEGALTSDESDELQQIFDEVSGTQFIALTKDPNHARALLEYDRHTRRHVRPIIILMLALFVVSVVVGVYVSMHH